MIEVLEDSPCCWFGSLLCSRFTNFGGLATETVGGLFFPAIFKRTLGSVLRREGLRELRWRILVLDAVSGGLGFPRHGLSSSSAETELGILMLLGLVAAAKQLKVMNEKRKKSQGAAMNFLFCCLWFFFG